MKSMLKNKFLILVLAGAIGLGSYFAFFHKKNLPEIRVDSLVVNEENTHKTVCVKSEKEGLVDAIHLSRTSDVEEAWIYSTCNNTWYEVGINQTERNNTIDVGYHNGVISSCPQVVDCHIHPTKELRSKRDKKILDLDTWDLVDATMPSPYDTVTMVLRSFNYYHFQPHGDYRFIVASPMGVIELKLTKEGQKALDNWSFYEVEAWVDRLYTGAIKGERCMLGRGLEEVVSRRCDYMNSSPFLTCSYTLASEITGEHFFPPDHN